MFCRLEIQDVNVQSQGIKLPEIKSLEDDESDDIYRKLIIPKKLIPRKKFSRAMNN